MPTVANDDVEVAYEVAGEGAPLVLVQGLGGVGAAWALVTEALAARGYRVVTLDNRGVGGTYMPRDATWSVPDMASDVLAVADAAGFGTFHVAGLSMGGMIAQELLVNHGERLRSATLLATNHGGAPAPGAPVVPPPRQDALEALLSPFDPADPEGSLHRLIGAMAGPGFVERHPERVQLLFRIGIERPVPARSFAAQMQAVMRWTSWPSLPDVTTPTAVVHGDSDPLIAHESGATLAGRIPSATLTTIEGAGHMLFLEAPEATADAIDSHARAQEAAAERLTDA